MKPACQCRRHKRSWFDPWVREDPLEEGMATHSSILTWRIPWRGLVGYSPRGHKESDRTETTWHACKRQARII